MNESEFPALYAAADTASKSAQKIFFTALAANLFLLCVAAILSAINVAAVPFALLQIFILIGSIGLTIYIAAKEPQRAWYMGRALSESVKTVTWRFMMRAEPFDVSDEIAKKHFLDGLKKILNSNRKICSLAIEIGHGNQITEQMTLKRNEALDARRNLYVTERIDDQLRWYQGKAKYNKKYSRVWFFLLIAANGFALFSAALRVAKPDAPSMTDIFVALSAAIMAWIQTKRFQELSASYALAALEISILKQNASSKRSDETFSTFVADAENAFSREHTQWQARRDEDH